MKLVFETAFLFKLKVKDDEGWNLREDERQILKFIENFSVCFGKELGRRRS